MRSDSPQKQPVPASRKGPQGGTSGGGDWPTAFPCSARGAAGRLASDSVTYFWQTRWAQSRIWAQTSWRALPSDRCDVLLSPPAGSVPESRRMRQPAFAIHAHCRPDASGTGGRVGVVSDAEVHGVTWALRSTHPAPEGQGTEGGRRGHGETARQIQNVGELRPSGLVSSTSDECAGIEQSTRVCLCTRVCASVCAGPVPGSSGPLCPCQDSP